MPQTLEDYMQYYLGGGPVPSGSRTRSPLQRLGLVQDKLTEEERREREKIERRALNRVLPAPAARQMTENADKEDLLGNFLEAAPDFSIGVRPETFLFPPQRAEKNPTLEKILGGAVGAAQMFGPGSKGGLIRGAAKTALGGGLGMFGTESREDREGMALGAAASRLGAKGILAAQKRMPELATWGKSLFPRAASAISEMGATAADHLVSGREVSPLAFLLSGGIGAASPYGGANAVANRKAAEEAQTGIQLTKDYAATLKAVEEQRAIRDDLVLQGRKEIRERTKTAQELAGVQSQKSTLEDKLKGRQGALEEATAKYRVKLPSTAKDLETAVEQQLSGLTEHAKTLKFPRDREVIEKVNTRLDQLQEIKRGVTASRAQLGPNVADEVLDASVKDQIDQYRKFFTPRDDKGRLLPTKIKRDDIRAMNKDIKDLEKELGAVKASEVNLQNTLDRIALSLEGNKTYRITAKQLEQQYGKNATALLKKNEELYATLLEQVPKNSTIHNFLSSVTPELLTAVDAAVIANTNPFGWARKDHGWVARTLGIYMRMAISDVKRHRPSEYTKEVPAHFEDLVAKFTQNAEIRENEPAARAAAALWRNYSRVIAKKRKDDDDNILPDMSGSLEDRMRYYLPE